MKKIFLIPLGIIVIILFGTFLLLRLNHPTQQTKQTSARPAALPKEVTITLNKNGFTPNKITVKIGTAVRWKNMSGANQTVNSDNYPINQLHKELNFGVFNNNSSVVYIFKNPGTYGYHNQLNPQQKGTVIVEN